MKKLLPLLLLVVTTASAQPPKEYEPSPVQGPAWNAPRDLNPILPGYFADPTIRKFGDTYYIYSTTDGTGNGYGPAQVWMSKDFVNWRNFVMNWPTTEVVWAPDVVKDAGGKYRYFYCEPCNINVGESASPIGPWTNLLGKEDAVLVPDRYVHNAITLDPMLFTDDDGSQYLYFTTWGIYKGFGCGVAKLKGGNPDLAALAQKCKDARTWNENNPFPIVADEFFSEKKLISNEELKDIFEAPFIFKKDGIYYFTYSSGSCHTDTYRVQYAISKTGPMGSFEYKGEILTTNEDQTVHGPGHHSILEQDGNYYIVYHRHNNPKSVHGFNRQVCIDKLEFTESGDIKKVIPTHEGINPLLVNAPTVDKTKLQEMKDKITSFISGDKTRNLAFGCPVTCSSYYDEWFKPEYAVDDNNATLWKAAHTNWDAANFSKGKNEWIQIDLGKVLKFTEIWTQFEYPTFFYQYKIETSTNGKEWKLFADRTDNIMQGSPMIDRGDSKARYIRLTITDTQKNGHIPAIWNIKVWQIAPELPEVKAESNDAYPGMHKKDVKTEDHKNVLNNSLKLRFADLTLGKNAPFDFNDIPVSNNKNLCLTSKRAIHARVKDGRWAMFFNGTQCLKTAGQLPEVFRYNGPYTISVYALQTKVGPVSTLVSLSDSRADLATTEFRLGQDSKTGLVNHNGSFESMGAQQEILESVGKWHHWVVTYDGWMERVYLDGKLVKEHNNFLMIRPSGQITIGADANETNNFIGYLSDIQILPNSLSAEEVEGMYKALTSFKEVESLGDDDFEEIDPNSKFTLNPNFKLQFDETDPLTLSAKTGAFNDDPLNNGAQVLREIQGDFVIQCHIDGMEGLATKNVKGYNEGGLLVSDGKTHYQFGAFPLYECGNLLTILGNGQRPQFPNHKGYDFDRYIQFERRGDLLFARSSADGKTWSNNPGSPIEITSPSFRVGLYQTTYTENTSWVKFDNVKIWY